MQSDDDGAAGAGTADSAGARTADPTGPSEGFPDRRFIDLSRDPHPGVPDHLAPDDAGDRPLIDLSRDPTPGVPDHAAPDDED